MQELIQSKVPRALETKTKIAGFELADILIIFLYLATSNFIFGSTALKPIMVWAATAALAGGLYFLKRGKPDDYLRHSVQFLLSDTVFVGGQADTEYRPLIQDGEQR